MYKLSAIQGPCRHIRAVCCGQSRPSRPCISSNNHSAAGECKLGHTSILVSDNPLSQHHSPCGFAPQASHLTMACILYSAAHSAFLDLTRCTSKSQNKQLQAIVVQMLSEPTTIDPVLMWQAQVITTEDDASRTRQLVATLCQNRDPAKPSTAALCDKLLASDSTQAVGHLLLV